MLFLRVVGYRTNAADNYENRWVCSVRLSLIESLMSRRADEFSEISNVYFRAG